MTSSRPLLDAVVVSDSCVYDSDAGWLCNGIPTKLATAGGKTLTLYDIRTDGKIYESERIPFPDRIIRVKYMKLTEQPETLLILCANGVFFTLVYVNQKPTVSEFCKITNPTFAKRPFVTFLPVSGVFAYIDDYGSLIFKDLSSSTTSVYPIKDADVCSILLIDFHYIAMLCDPLLHSTKMKIYYIFDNQLREDKNYDLTGKHSRLLCLGDPFNAIFSVGERSTEYIQINAPFEKFNVTAPPCLINAYFISVNNWMLFSTINDGLILIKVALNGRQTPVFEVRRSSPELHFNTVSATAGSHLFFGSSHVDHVVATIFMGFNNDFVFQVLQTIRHLGPIIAVDCAHVGKQTKLIVASGDPARAKLSILSNELEFFVESRLKAAHVEHIFPLKINSTFTNGFIASTKNNSSIFMKNNDGVLKVHSKLQGAETLAAASICTGEVFAHITEHSISILSLKSPQNTTIHEKRVFKNSITAAAIHGASAQILVAMEGKVQLISIKFDEQNNQQVSLMNVATADLESPVTCITFLNVDSPFHCVFGMERCSYLDVRVLQSLSTLFQIKLPGSHSNPNGLIHELDYLIVNVKPGLVYVYEKFDLVNKKAGTPKKIDNVYGIDKLVSLDTRGFGGLCSGTDCTVIRKCGGRLEYSKVTTNIRTLCDMSDPYHRGYFLASNKEELQFGYFQKATKSIKTNEAILGIAAQNSTKTFAIATEKYENVQGISSTVAHQLTIPRLCDRNEFLDSEFRAKPDRIMTRILFFNTEGGLTPIYSLCAGPHEAFTSLLSCYSASYGKEFYFMASVLDYPSTNPRPISKLISGLFDKSKNTFICYLNYDLPNNRIGRPGISQYLNTLMLNLGSDIYEWTWDPKLTTTKEKVSRLSSAIQAARNIGTGVYTAQSSSSTEVVNPGWKRRNGPEVLQEAHMDGWTALSEYHILGGVTDKRIRCYDINHEVLATPVRQRRVDPVTVGGILNVASTMTCLRSTSQLTNLYQNGAQAIYATKSGSVGFVLRMSQTFGDVIKQIISVATTSETFTNKYPYYSVLNNARNNSGEFGFDDGESLRLLMQMDKSEVLAILRDAIALKPGLKGPLEWYSTLEELHAALYFMPRI